MRCSSQEAATRKRALRMRYQFLDKDFQVGRKEAFRVPCEHRPFSNWCFVVDKRNCVNTPIKVYSRRQNTNPIASFREPNNRIMRATLKQNNGVYIRRLTRNVKPFARSETAAQD